VFCLLVVLIKLLVLAKRKTPLRKPLRGKRIVSTKLRPKNVHDFFCLVYCFIVLLSVCLVSRPYIINLIFLWVVLC